MIALRATSPDGEALVDDDGALRLIRPPYRHRHRYPVSEKQAALALLHGDFQPADGEFAGWKQLHEHLEQHRVESATQSELVAAKHAALRLLMRATPQQVARHLERIDEELRGKT